MRLTTKGRFAVTAMVDLGLHATSKPVKLADISERQNISLSYLEQLFCKLRKAELVRSVRGPGGGYVLAGSLPDTTVADIIAAVDEPIDATVCGHSECKTGKNGAFGGNCMTHELWTNLNRHIYEYLSSVSLQEICDRQQSAPQDNGVSVVSAPRTRKVAQPSTQKA